MPPATDDNPPLDIEQPEQLVNYLRRTDRIGPGESPELTVLAGGVSNRTVLVERANGDTWVLKQALEKLRVDVDWFSDPARVHREAEGIRALSELAPDGAITPLVFEDATHHLLAMDAVPTPHENWKQQLLRGSIGLDCVRQFGELLATIHREAWRRRETFETMFNDRSFFESLRIEPYYQYSAAQVPAAEAFLDELIADCRARPLTLVHGDYSPKNILVHPPTDGRIVLLDHEVIHWGDPAFDLGFSVTHLLSKAHHLRPHRDAFIEAAGEYWNTYLQTLGDVAWRDDVEPMAARHTLGCLLARVAGRSKLEYMDDAERGRQQAAVVTLMAEPPTSMPELIDRFVQQITDRN